MAALAAPLIIAGGTVLAAGVGAGIQAWFNSSAQESALKEHRRSEKLRIKFAEEETVREEKKFQRTTAITERAQNFNISQSILQNVRGMFESNRANTNQIINFNRNR